MIKETIFRGLKSVELTGPALTATVIVELGAKLASLVDNKTGYEFFFQGKGDTHPRLSYGDNFASGDLSGFEDMFPGVNAGPYPSFPWLNAMIPDHGELWAIPWEHEIQGETLCMRTHGVRFPYRFEKRLSFAEDDRLRTDYTITNLSDYPLDFIWAAHALLNLRPGAKLELPPGVKQVINTMTGKNRLGEIGALHPWPNTTDKNGAPYALDTILPPDADICEKFYAWEPLDEGWVRLKGLEHGMGFRFEFPVDKVPYIGIWLTEGGFLGQYNGALEVATGAYDDLYLAKKWGKCPSIPPRGEYVFRLDSVVERS